MTETLATEIQKLAPSARLELFEVDATAIGGVLSYFHAGTNKLREAVVWQGVSYLPFPIEASGFALNGTTQAPRPKLTIADVDGLVTALCEDLEDFTGAIIRRHRTFAKFLDAENFPAGNPDANPAEEVVDVWYVDRKSASVAGEFVEWELASAMDLQDAELPARQIVGNSCNFAYRGEECGYSGPPVADLYDKPTSDPAQDRCGKRLASCKLRFGEHGELSTGAFPGAGLTR